MNNSNQIYLMIELYTKKDADRSEGLPTTNKKNDKVQKRILNRKNFNQSSRLGFLKTSMIDLQSYFRTSSRIFLSSVRFSFFLLSKN